MSQLPLPIYSFVPEDIRKCLSQLELELNFAASFHSHEHSSLNGQEAKRRQRIYEQWSDPEVEPLPDLTEDDLFDAVMTDFRSLILSQLDDSAAKFMGVYDYTAAAHNIAEFEADLLESIIHETNHNFRGPRHQRDCKFWTKADVFMPCWQIFDQDYESLLEGIYGIETHYGIVRLEYTACGVGLRALSSLKQQGTACCL